MDTALTTRAKALIREVPNFPKKGVSFKDISPLLESPVFGEVIEALAEKAEKIRAAVGLTAIAGLESRGFIIGVALAQKLNLPFVMIRKAGKLPPPVVRRSIVTEYSTDTLEMTLGKGDLLIADDVIALGGTLEAATALAKDAGYEVRGLLTMIDLKYLPRKGATIDGLNVDSLIIYE